MGVVTPQQKGNNEEPITPMIIECICQIISSKHQTMRFTMQYPYSTIALAPCASLSHAATATGMQVSVSNKGILQQPEL